jgi:RNA polymerase sigma factor (sigma-70 family)
MSDSAETLCMRARAGDTEAARALVELTYERIYAYLRRLSGQDEDAADLTQKTFGKAWTSLGSFGGRSSFTTWLHGIAHHTYLDWRRQQRPGTSQPEEWWQAQSSGGPSPLDDTMGRDLARQLFALVEQLDEDTRHTVHLHYYEDLSLAETAQVLGVATSTVKYRLRQALDFLRARAAEPKVFLR